MEEKSLTPTTTYEEILKQASQQKSFIFRFSKAYPAYIILIIMIILSIGGWYVVGQKVNSDRSAAFDKATTSIMNRLEFKYRNDYQVLQSMRSLYDNYVQVVRDVFELYGTIPTRTYSSILTILYVPRVYQSGLEDYILYVRSQGYYDYAIHPPGERDIYYLVEYVVPLENNLHRSGWDLGTNEIIKNAIEKAKDNNIVTATEIFAIRPPDTTGFFLISPVYDREAIAKGNENLNEIFQGVLALEIDAKTFFETALGTGVATDTSIIFQCLDINHKGDTTLVFESENAFLLGTNFIPLLTDTRILNIADREVLVKFYSIPNFGGALQSLLPIITFILGLLISFGFSAFILSIISSRARAVDLAERMTRSQRRILESSNDIIAVLTLDGVWKSMNPASKKIFGLSPQEMIGKKFDEILVYDEEIQNFYKIINQPKEEFTERIDTQVKANGEIKWISWSLTVSKNDGYIYCIGRDITSEKLAEEEAALRSRQNQLAEQMAREVSEFKTFFMLKLSHQFRNLLTSLMGYLQLLSQKVYDSEEERENFVELAVQSSEELFTFVSDINEVAMGSSDTEKIDLSFINVNRFIESIKENYRNLKDKEVHFEILDGKDASFVADSRYLSQSFMELIDALTDGSGSNEIKINAQENPFEAATELQILTPASSRSIKMVNLYNENLNNLINALKYDKKDILLRIALTASTIRMMNGTMKIDALGENEGIIVQITLPLNKPAE